MKNTSISLLKKSRIEKDQNLILLSLFSEIDLVIHISRWLSSFRTRTRGQIESEQIKFNLNKWNMNKRNKNTTQSTLSHYFHFSRYHSSRHDSLLLSRRFLFACVCDSKSQSFWSSWSFSHDESSIFYLLSFFSSFLSPRSLSLRQSWFLSR